MRGVLVCLGVLLGLGFAQAGDAVALAREAVAAWQAGELARELDPARVLEAGPEEWARVVRELAAFSPPPVGLEVNLEAPEVETTPVGTLVRFPAVVGSRGGDVRVLVRDGEVTRVAWVPEGGLLPGWVWSPAAAWGFALASLLFVSGLRRGVLGRWWREGWSVVRRHWRLYLWVNAVLYGLFVLGALGAYAAPELARAVQELVGGALAQIGFEGTEGRGVLQLALVIFYWNFTQGVLLTSFAPALLLGVPAFLINALRYYFFGFALSPALFPAGTFVWHVPTLVIELQAYILVTFGGLALLASFMRSEGVGRGVRLLAWVFGGTFLAMFVPNALLQLVLFLGVFVYVFNRVVQSAGGRAGLRALGLSLVLATVFLLVGAWYEAFELLYLLGG
ncbi:hypothetical protein [Marinithermus hydrothermalis]|uniref:Stage II sporulation protein M n=1 Tax=Marinithermus hydrothermalis (strain DSM 14884 / JCM 11576 / T1) TaxID=869210 RepID=F2NKH3_MARHT|nr:hypothetical protein [Marinithermus hydrothermalis]AEB12633.1 hypothetical protein Marky_1902 [Marinithermus hydrothermalis DSM 14884]